MGAVNTKGTKVCIVSGGATGTPETLTGATPATATANASIDIADTTGYATGDLITLAANSSGIASLDGKTWAVSVTSGTELQLLGSKGAATGTFTAGAPATGWTADNGDFECLCLSGISFSPETPETISTGTYCDPTAQVAGAATGAGTAELTGYANIADSDYQEILAAIADGKTREFRILLPSNGAIVFPGEFASINWDIPLSGAVGYTVNLTLDSAPKHVF